MNTTERSIYEDDRFQDLDIGAVMREGHPDIVEGDDHILSVIRDLHTRLRRPLTIIDVGAGSGHLTEVLARAFPSSEVIANEIASIPVAQARRKLMALRNARIFDRPFEEWRERVDVVVSWGSHHHLCHDYLNHIRDVLTPDGLLLIGDEMCPEYLTEADRERLSIATVIQLVDGYIFDRTDDIDSYRRSGTVPEWNRNLEFARRKALWTWYKFVCDFAIERQSWTVLISELQIARDDLVTDCASEHKTSPFLLERELDLKAFPVLERKTIGERSPALQSFVLYTCRPGARLTLI